MNELILKVEQWAEDRNLINGCKPIDQAMKLFSKAGELADNIGKGRNIKDDVGDVLVVLTVISKQLGTSLTNVNFNKLEWAEGDSKKLVNDLFVSLSEFVKFADVGVWYDGILKRSINILNAIAKNNNVSLFACLSVAYNDIKDRKGTMINGVFIKEGDIEK